MKRSLMKSTLAGALLVGLVLMVTACAPGSPEEKVAEIRSNYTVELNSWRVLEPEPAEMPAEGEDIAEGEEAPAEDTATEDTAGEGEEAAAEGEEGMDAMADAEPRTDAVLFDLVVYFRGNEGLPGVTVDITQAGADQQEKAVYHHFIDTEGIVNGDTRQEAFELEGVEFAEGDVFAVSLKPGIPADISEYREFSGLAAGGE